ncbi:MAG TPA: helix-turn-helix domain-containing protein [Vulgatibacter sp.]
MSAPSHYDALGLGPRATRDEIRQAFERLSSVLGTDSLAVYALVDSSERDEELARIREAHRVLGDPTSRRRYDEVNGFAAEEVELGDADIVSSRPLPAQRGVPPSAVGREMAPDESASATSAQETAKDVASLDPSGDGAAGATSAQETAKTAAAEPIGGAAAGSTSAQETAEATDSVEEGAAGAPSEQEIVTVDDDDVIEELQAADGALEEGAGGSVAEARNGPVLEVDEHTEFTGALLRALREARGLSLKDIAARTRIGTNHLHNIEEEAFDLLPERVFLRGFLLSVARELKLDAKRVADTYLLRRGG